MSQRNASTTFVALRGSTGITSLANISRLANQCKLLVVQQVADSASANRRFVCYAQGLLPENVLHVVD
eukprot:11173201-Lingulodinium_polyedra.AAC.1